MQILNSVYLPGPLGHNATRMCSSIIEYTPTTTPTLDVRFIASRAATAIAAAVASQHLACVALNLLQAIIYSLLFRRCQAAGCNS